MFTKIKNWIKEVFTDAAGRPEIKVILGVPITAGAVVYGMMSKDWDGFTKLSMLGGALLGTTAVTDAVIDHGLMGK